MHQSFQNGKNYSNNTLKPIIEIQIKRFKDWRHQRLRFALYCPFSLFWLFILISLNINPSLFTHTFSSLRPFQFDAVPGVQQQCHCLFLGSKQLLSLLLCEGCGLHWQGDGMYDHGNNLLLYRHHLWTPLQLHRLRFFIVGQRAV